MGEVIGSTPVSSNFFCCQIPGETDFHDFSDGLTSSPTAISMLQMPPTRDDEPQRLTCAFQDIYSRYTDLLHSHALAARELYLYYNGDADDPSPRSDFRAAYDTLMHSLADGRKLVFVACGKSFRIIAKTVATCHSLGIPAAALHPTEAMHGDIGIVADGDALLLCSHSGETDELLQLAAYVRSAGLAPTSPLIAVTSAPASSLARRAHHVITIFQPAHLRERAVQDGLNAPTIATTLMLLALDCLVLALSDGGSACARRTRVAAFAARHPGGSIGSHARAPTPPDPPAAPAIAEYSGAETLAEFLDMIVTHDFVRVRGQLHSAAALQRRYARASRDGLPWTQIMSAL
ncbi:AaceriAFR544Wp [[Ashbya] aceris (nom. inval.)]|nr:AaceriAFR544Wp [[Ashbya] aceris (nom. inval.)]